MANTLIFGPWCGGVTSSSAEIKAAVSADAQAKLLVSKSESLGNPVLHQPNLFSASDMTTTSFPISGLDPETQYHYALEVDGVLAADHRGRFRTFPREDAPASFTFVCAGDASTG